MGQEVQEGYIELETEWKNSKPLLQEGVGDGNVNHLGERTFYHMPQKYCYSLW